MATLKLNKMKKRIMDCVMLFRLAYVRSSKAFVNVFKKKVAEHCFEKANNLNWTEKFILGYLSGSVIITAFRVLL